MNLKDRFPDFEPLSVEELKARGRELSRMYAPGHSGVHVDLTVDQIPYCSSPEERLAKLKVVFNNSTGGRWGTGLSQMRDDPVSPIVGHSIGAPVCRFDRIGSPDKDFADCRFIVAAHESFEWLLELAEEGLAARKAANSE